MGKLRVGVVGAGWWAVANTSLSSDLVPKLRWLAYAASAELSSPRCNRPSTSRMARRILRRC